jgi:cardiolipin synthase A/B
MNPVFAEGNAIDLLETGDAYFPALLAAIDGARHEIHVETYILEDDPTGRRITDALIRARQRGVIVRVMIDGFGSKDLPPAFAHHLVDAGIEFLVYRRRISPLTLRRQRLRRLHRKIVIIDAAIAFVGGINIIDDRNTPKQKPPRFDYAVRIRGPLLDPVCHAVRRLWSRVARVNLGHQRHDPAMLPPVAAACGTTRAAFVQRDNLAHRRDIEEAYLGAINGATTEIVIANAYFFPGRRFRHALVAAAGRGVRVVLLLQGRVEYLLMHFASHALYGSFLDAGMEIFEYHKSFLHAKVAVVDGRWATVGSSNIDPFSLLLAREANVVVDDPAFAAGLRGSLERAMRAGAERKAKKRWDREPLMHRLVIWVCYGITRVLIGAIGYAGWH